MSDLRITKLAKVLVNYSLEILSGQKLYISTNPIASELTLAVYEEAIKTGAFVQIAQPLQEAQEIFYKFASDGQLDFISPVEKLIAETFDARLNISASLNNRLLSGIDPSKIARHSKAQSKILKTYMDRSAQGDLNWCMTIFPNHADAQDAGMSLRDYSEFVYAAGMLNEEDPVAYWQEQNKKQSSLMGLFKGHEKVTMKGSNIDLTLSIKDRNFINGDGRKNFPDGEIYTSPVETSANGWVRFRYPAIYMRQEIEDIELWFENGKVITQKAAKNEELLKANLETDEGARYLGEWGIGTNYGITKFTKNMLFDEKIGGTIHLAIGSGFPEAGGKNESAVHWDMLCDMNEGEIIIDGDLFYRNGKFIVE